jgi:hypothetical protein
VDDGPTVRIAEGAEASVGDLIICRRNDHGIEAGEPGRALANGDVLHIEAITSSGVMVRRLLDPDRATGQRQFTGQAFHYPGYQSSDLAYAVTGHSSQGSTVHTGIALVTGNEDRHWLYPAMTRGTDTNLAFVFTTPLKEANPPPRTRPASKLGQDNRIRGERQAFSPDQPAAGPGSPDLREPIAVLADILGRDGAELSATQTRQRNLANTDHLAVLHAIWDAETRATRDGRYRDLVMAALPLGYQQPLSHQARWLFRTLRTAELAGLDPAEVIRTAIVERNPAGSRDIAAVLDARIRPRLHPLLPQPQVSWTRRVPDLPDPDRRAYLGQHAAKTAPAWAITALGPVPADPAARRDWEHEASAIAAYREMYGYEHPGDPVGPEPSREAPDQRAAWHQAFAALGPADSPDVRAVPDGRLWLIRDTYAAETARAPRHPGRELRLARLAAADADLGAIRAAAEAARKVCGHARAARHEDLAASYRAMRDYYQQRETVLAQAMADRLEWEHGTAQSRHLAVAADAELRRRHPYQKIEPLRSAEPGPASDAHSEQPHLPSDQKISEIAGWIHDLAAQHQAFRARMDERRRLMVPSKDPVWADLGEAFPVWRAPSHDAILQPPKPEITPSTRSLQLAAGYDTEPEAAN